MAFWVLFFLFFVGKSKQLWRHSNDDFSKPLEANFYKLSFCRERFQLSFQLCVFFKVGWRFSASHETPLAELTVLKRVLADIKAKNGYSERLEMAFITSGGCIPLAVQMQV